MIRERSPGLQKTYQNYNNGKLYEYQANIQACDHLSECPLLCARLALHCWVSVLRPRQPYVATCSFSCADFPAVEAMLAQLVVTLFALASLALQPTQSRHLDPPRHPRRNWHPCMISSACPDSFVSFVHAVDVQQGDLVQHVRFH